MNANTPQTDTERFFEWAGEILPRMVTPLSSHQDGTWTFDVRNRLNGINHHRLNERGEWEMCQINARGERLFIVRQ